MLNVSVPLYSSLVLERLHRGISGIYEEPQITAQCAALLLDELFGEISSLHTGLYVFIILHNVNILF